MVRGVGCGGGGGAVWRGGLGLYLRPRPVHYQQLPLAHLRVRQRVSEIECVSECLYEIECVSDKCVTV